MSATPTYESYLLLGTNMGDRVALLARATAAITRDVGTIRAASSIYVTEAWGVEGQPPYLNQAICVDTPLLPTALLAAINAIEAELGRTRGKKWASRPMDIDILLYATQVVNKPGLIIPHPLLPARRFALTPLQAIAPDVVHPQIGKTISEMLHDTADELSVRRYDAPTPDREPYGI